VAVYSGVSQDIYGMRLVFKIPLFLLYTIIFPLLALLYIVHKDNRVSEMIKTPYFKFISHISQFIVFLCLIAASALRDTHAPTILGKNIARLTMHYSSGAFFLVNWGKKLG
jgi:hypothetical protein